MDSTGACHPAMTYHFLHRHSHGFRRWLAPSSAQHHQHLPLHPQRNQLELDPEAMQSMLTNEVLLLWTSEYPLCGGEPEVDLQRYRRY